MPALSWLWSIVSFVTGVLAGALYVQASSIRLEPIHWFARHKPATAPLSTENEAIARRGVRKTSRRRTAIPSPKEAGDSVWHRPKKDVPSSPTPILTSESAEEERTTAAAFASQQQPTEPLQPNAPQQGPVTMAEVQHHKEQGQQVPVERIAIVNAESVIPIDAESRWRDHHLKRQWAESILQQTIEPSLSRHLRHAIKAVLHMTMASPETMDMIPMNPVSRPWEALMSPIVFSGHLGSFPGGGGVGVDHSDHHGTTTAATNAPHHHLKRLSNIGGASYTRSPGSARFSSVFSASSSPNPPLAPSTSLSSLNPSPPTAKLPHVPTTVSELANSARQTAPSSSTTSSPEPGPSVFNKEFETAMMIKRSSTSSNISRQSTVETTSNNSTRPSSSTDAEEELLSLPHVPSKETTTLANATPQEPDITLIPKGEHSQQQQPTPMQEVDLSDDIESLRVAQEEESTTNSPTRSSRPRRIWSKVRQVVRVADFGFNRRKATAASSIYQLSPNSQGGRVMGKFGSISDTHLPYNRNAAFSFQLESAASSTADLSLDATVNDGPTSALQPKPPKTAVAGSMPLRTQRPAPPPPLTTEGLYLGWGGRGIASQRRISTVFETPPETADNSRSGSVVDFRQEVPIDHHHSPLPSLLSPHMASTKALAVAAETTMVEPKANLVSVREYTQSSTATISRSNEEDQEKTKEEEDMKDSDKSVVENTVIQLRIQSPTSPATVFPFPEPMTAPEPSGSTERDNIHISSSRGTSPQRGNSLDVPRMEPTRTRKSRAMSVGQDLEQYLSARPTISQVERHHRQPSGQISSPPPSSGLDALKRLSRELAAAHERSPSCPVSPRSSVIEPNPAPRLQPKDSSSVSAVNNMSESSFSSYPLPVLPASKEERRLSALSFGGYFSNYGSGTGLQQQQSSSQSGSRVISGFSGLVLPSLPSFSPPKSEALATSSAVGLSRSATRISDATIHQEGRHTSINGSGNLASHISRPTTVVNLLSPALSEVSGLGSTGTAGAIAETPSMSPLARKLPPPLRIVSGLQHTNISAPSPILPPPFSAGILPRPLHLPTPLDRHYYGVEQVHEWRIPSYGRVRFTDHSPQVFRVIRQRFQYSLEDLDEALSQAFTVMTTPGKSDAIFFASHNNGRFLLKTLRGAEPDNLKGFLPDYVDHIHKYPNTLLPRYLGMFTFEKLGPVKGGSTGGGQDGDRDSGSAAGAPHHYHQRNNSHRRQENASTSHSTAKHLHMNGTLLSGGGRDDCLPTKVTVVVIANVFDTSSVVHERYDFKGSNVGRMTLVNPTHPPPPPVAPPVVAAIAAALDTKVEDASGGRDVSSSSRRLSGNYTGNSLATAAVVTGPTPPSESDATRTDISHLTLKEIDFQTRVLAGETQLIHLGPIMRRELLHQLEEDTLLLRKHGFMDYSMLVGIHIVPKKPEVELETAVPPLETSEKSRLSSSETPEEGVEVGANLTSTDSEDDDDGLEDYSDAEPVASDDTQELPPTALDTLLETLQTHMNTSYEYLTHTQQTAQVKVAEFWNAHKDVPWIQDLISNAEATREWLQHVKDKKLRREASIKGGERHRGSVRVRKSRRSRRRAAVRPGAGEDGLDGFQTPLASRMGTLRGSQRNLFSTVRAHSNPWRKPAASGESDNGDEVASASTGTEPKMAQENKSVSSGLGDVPREGDEIKDTISGQVSDKSGSSAVINPDAIRHQDPASKEGGSSNERVSASLPQAPTFPPHLQQPPQHQHGRPIWSNGVAGVNLPDGTEVIYFFGLIDILQKYNLVKWLERNIKGANVRLLGSSPPSAGIGGPSLSAAPFHIKEPSASGIGSFWGGGGGGGGGGHHESSNSLGSLSKLLPMASASEPYLPLSSTTGGYHPATTPSSPPMVSGGLSRSTSRTALGGSPGPSQYHHSRRTTGNLSSATQASFNSEKDEGISSSTTDANNVQSLGRELPSDVSSPLPRQSSARETSSSSTTLLGTNTTANGTLSQNHIGMPVVQPPTPTVASPYPQASQFPQHLEVSVEEPGRYAERLVDYMRGAIV